MRAVVWPVDEDLADDFPGSIELYMVGNEEPWIEGSETSPHVVVGVMAENHFASDQRGRLVFPTIDACRDWIRRLNFALSLETWVQEAPE